MAALLVIIGAALLVIVMCLATRRRKPRDGAADGSGVGGGYAGASASAYDRPRTDVGSFGSDGAAMRHFTLAELRAAPDGMYHWDEGGSVFAVNDDGSVTMVGTFDSSEVDPVTELYEDLVSDGLGEMLPAHWTFLISPGNEDMSWHYYASIPEGGYEVVMPDFGIGGSKPELVKIIDEGRIIPYESSRGWPGCIEALIHTGTGWVVLMPADQTEYTLSLGAKACIERHFVGRVQVHITSPAAMGAFWAALKPGANAQTRVSFAFGEGDSYQCCNLSAADGVYRVDSVVGQSIIMPLERQASVIQVLTGALALSFVDAGQLVQTEFRDMLYYSVTLTVVGGTASAALYGLVNPISVPTADGFVVYGLVNPASLPTAEGWFDISVPSGGRLVLLIGHHPTPVLQDVLAECGLAAPADIRAKIEFEAKGDMVIEVHATNGMITTINVGQLIG